MSQPEQVIIKAVMDYLALFPHKWLALRFDSVGIYDPTRKRYRLNMSRLRGVSDIILFTETGRVLFLEVKTPKGKLTENQKGFAEKVTNLGYRYCVVTSVEEVQELLWHKT